MIINYSIKRVSTNNGSTLSGSTVASPFGDYIFLGNVMDEKFLLLKHNK